MKKKKEIEFEFVTDEGEKCEVCGSIGIRSFEDGNLCFQCTLDDVTGRMNENED